MKWPIIFRPFELKNEGAAREALRQAELARETLHLMIHAYSNGRSISFSMLGAFEVGKEYHMDQEDGEGPSLDLVVIESSKRKIIMSCDYPGDGVLGDHYHPDCEETILVDEGSLTVSSNVSNGLERVTLNEGEHLFVPEGVLHNAIAGSSGCKFRVIFERKL